MTTYMHLTREELEAKLAEAECRIKAHKGQEQIAHLDKRRAEVRAEAAEARLAEAERHLGLWRQGRDAGVVAVIDRAEAAEASLRKMADRVNRERARVEALEKALEPFIDQRRCQRGVRMEGDCLQAKDPKPCRICAARAALAAGRKP